MNADAVLCNLEVDGPPEQAPLTAPVESPAGVLDTTLAQSSATRAPVGASEGKVLFESVRVMELVKKALDGTLPRERAPHYWEPSILTPLHINMVLDRAGGYQLKEIAERWDYTTVQVANVLAHPDSQTILSTILAMQAGALVSMESRFAALAPEAMNVKVELMRNENVPPHIRNHVASDILDRAGYAPRRQAEVAHTHQILVPAQAATGLRDALHESSRVASVDYSAFLQKPGVEVAAMHLQVDEVGHLETADSASPVPASGSEAAAA